MIDLVLELEQRCRVVPLLGNHELMLLDARAEPARASARGCECGGDATVRELRRPAAATFRPSTSTSSAAASGTTKSPTHFFVHANYAADVPLDEQPDYLLFWEHLHFHLPPPHENGKIAIVGHTSQKIGEILDLGHVICIDTFCHGGGWLTALDVDSGQIWQADRQGRLRAE